MVTTLIITRAIHIGASILIAGIVVWFGTQTWDWTQQMTWPKTATCFALGWVALIVLATQEYNPFIYFIF